MTHSEDFAHGLDGLLYGDVVAVQNGEESGFEDLLVFLLVFSGERLEFLSKVA